MPFVTNNTYSVHWDVSPIDWLTLNLESDLFEDNEWVHLWLNFTDHRENFTAVRGKIPTWANTSDPNFVDPTVLTFKNNSLDPTDSCGTYN